MMVEYRQQLTNVKPLLTAYVEAEEGSIDEKDKQKELINYLNEQDMEFVKAIQVILHIGRTKEVSEGADPERLYAQVMESFNLLKGWRTKEIEVRNMIIKVPLDQYFMKGIEILKIK